MQNYELLYILPGTLSEDEVKPVIEEVKNTVTENDGKNYTCDDMGKSRLAYPMKHIRYGYFQLAHFQAETNQVILIEKKLRLLNKLLRVLVQKHDPNKKIQRINFEQVQSQEQSVAVEPTVSAQVQAATINASEPEGENKEEKKTEIKTRKRASKVNLDDIDKKLDEILEIDINKV